jgi:hypothetical protein
MNSLLTPSIIANVEDVQVASVLALLTILILIALLVQRELTTNLETELAYAMRKVVVIGIIPYLIAFFMIFILRVLQSG